jgi:hypothetical protein
MLIELGGRGNHGNSYEFWTKKKSKIASDLYKKELPKFDGNFRKWSEKFPIWMKLTQEAVKKINENRETPKTDPQNSTPKLIKFPIESQKI